MITLHATDKPRWYQLRWKLSSLLVRLAGRIYPENPEVTAFWMNTVMDHMIWGKTVLRIDPSELEKETGDER